MARERAALTRSRPRFALAVLAPAAMISVATAAAQTAAPPSTKDFIAAAAQSDHFEILEAQTALGQTSDPRIRAFAREMIQDHAGTSRALAQAAIASGMGPPPPGLSGDQAKLLGALQSLGGPAFNCTYAKQQVLAHQQALVVEQAYAAGGSNPSVRAAARSAVPIIQSHLEMADKLRSEYSRS